MKKLALIGALAVFSFPVSAETVGEQTGVNSTLGIAPTTADFVQEAAISDLFEIQSSQLAQDKLQGREKEFASQMIADHTKTSTELKSAATEANINVPTKMDSSHQSMLDRLKGLNGNDFRRLYFSDQVSAHKDAVSLFTRYGKGGDNAKLKQWAVQNMPTLQHHLEMAQDEYKNS